MLSCKRWSPRSWRGWARGVSRTDSRPECASLLDVVEEQRTDRNLRWIGLTPILNYGTESQKRAVIDPVLAGDKHIALAISEAFAGSDVAGLQTTATLTPDGKVRRPTAFARVSH